MKLNFHDAFEVTATYTDKNAHDGGEFVCSLLRIDGVKSVFVCQDFITINRAPGANWDLILQAARKLFGADSDGVAGDALQFPSPSMEKSGEVSVLVQTFKGIAIQVKAIAPGVEKRIALSQRFALAAQSVQDKTGADFLKERYWADWGVRYGEPDEIAAQVADEIEGTTDENTLRHLCDLAEGKAQTPKVIGRAQKLSGMKSSDWHDRLKIVQELGSEEDIPLLETALADEQMQVRRFAAAGLGSTGSARAVDALCRALLCDAAVAVRRTAGDALSDIGDVSAQPSVCKSLGDENKLVRWRACRFLAEVGTEEALSFLQPVLSDSEYEVRLEAQAAVDRITRGSKGSLPVWKRMHEGPSGT